MKTVKLLGSKREQIYTMLKLAGWYENRQVDISCAETYYKSNNIEMYESVKSFYKEFYGIEDSWYIEHYNSNWAPDFEFCLFPKCFGYIDNKKLMHYADYRELIHDDAEYKVFTDAYKKVNSVANDDCIIIASIGYYYPSTVWIDKSGNLYATHEYDNIVYKFFSVLELIEHELSKIQLEKVMMKTMD